MRVRRKTLPALLLLLAPLFALGWLVQKEFGRLEQRALRTLESRARQVLDESIEEFTRAVGDRVSKLGAELRSRPDSAARTESPAETALRMRDSEPALNAWGAFDGRGALVFPRPQPPWTDALLFAETAPSPALRRAEHAAILGDLQKARSIADAELARLEPRGRGRPPALVRARFQSAALARRLGEPEVSRALYRRILDDADRFAGDGYPPPGPMVLFARLGLAEIESGQDDGILARQLLHDLATDRLPPIPEALARAARTRLLRTAGLDSTPFRDEDAQQSRQRRFADRSAGRCEAVLRSRLEEGRDDWPLILGADAAARDSVIWIEPSATAESDGFLAFELDWRSIVHDVSTADRDFAIAQYPAGERPDGATEPLRTRVDPFGLEWSVAMDPRGEALTDSRRGARNRVLVLLALIFSAVLGAALLLRTTAREAELAEAKLALLSRVSHDLRTPLSLIRLYAETLGLGRAKSPEQTSEFADVIVREADALDRQVDRMIDSAARRRPDFRYRKEPTDVSAALADWAAVFEPRARGEGFAFETAIEPDLSATLDRQALESAIENLCENALKYGRARNRPDATLDAEPGPPNPTIALHAGSTGDRLWIEVRDDGAGVPRADRRRIFESFERGANAREARGSGLGLWLVADFAKNHGGSVTVSETHARDTNPGATFRIDLPLDR